jgi:hypothetical protein
MSNLTTEDYIKKFYKLFERYDFYCNTFYIILNTNVCKMILCTHSKTGYRILIDIPEELNIVFDKRISSTIDNIITIEQLSCDVSDTNINELYIAKKYKNDELFNSHQLDMNNDNMDSILMEEYKYNIDITESKTFKYNLKDVINQLNRLKHILTPITHYGIAIESQNIIGFTKLNSNNEIGAFKINKSSKDTRLLYVVLSLDIFYDKRKTIDETVVTIHSGIMNVLNHNFNKQITLLKSLITKCIDSTNQVQYIHENQKKYEKYYESLSPVNNTNDVVQRIKLLNKIDCIGLCIDKIMFDNLIAYNTIINNYELLIKMEKIL